MVEHILKASLDRDLIITIMYLKGTEITMRNIKVLEIKEDRIQAYCYLRKEKRVFKKESILSAAFLNTKETRHRIHSFA
jgi:coproporphyrinogen III oxidase-like Fe-S oxidoreductase